MSVSYEKLIVLLYNNKIQHKVLKAGSGISNDEIAKIKKDEYLTLYSVECLVKYLSKELGREIKVEDILTFK